MISIYLSMLDTEQERKKVKVLYKEHKYALVHYAIKIVKNQDMAKVYVYEQTHTGLFIPHGLMIKWQLINICLLHYHIWMIL